MGLCLCEASSFRSSTPDWVGSSNLDESTVKNVVKLGESPFAEVSEDLIALIETLRADDIDGSRQAKMQLL
jgi:hypothetical protein